MKYLLFSIFALLLLGQSTFAEVGEDSLSKIYTLISEKKYPEALAAHQQYFKDTKGTSYSAVRLSFGLGSWAELGKLYPPAHMALVQLAADRKKIIYAGKADFNVLQEYTSINSYIERQDESIETFHYVERHFPEQVQNFYPLLEDTLIAKKQYAVIKKYAGDAIYSFESLRNSREYSLSQLRKNQQGYKLESINLEFEKKFKTLLETTEKIGMQDEALEIQRRYDSYMNGNLIRKYH
jgi:hypothetical protein